MRPDLRASLARVGYTRESAGFQLRLMAHVSGWLAAQGRDAAALDADAVEAFLALRRADGYTRFISAGAMAPLLGYLRGVGAAPAAAAPVATIAAEVLLERYRRYLLVERGLAAGTARGYVDAVRPFLAEWEAAGGLRLERLTAAELSAFVVARCPHRVRRSAKMTVTATRSLVGFLHLEGIVPGSLAGAVPSVASWRLAGLPRALEPWQLRRLFDSCDRRTRSGRRDYAILAMLARLGLRAGEVAGLELADLDWRAGEVVVRGKGRRVDRLPLPADVGEALAAYLRRGRPASAQGRSVFVRVRAPHRALSAGGVKHVVVAAGRRAGLGQIHPHRLRHSAASAMLRAGAPLSEIGQLLRHRWPLTTAIYAKVDREALRQLARPWPGARS